VNITEIGRELKTGDLMPEMVIWTNPEHRPDVFASLWVAEVSASMVWLYAGASNPPISLGLFRQPDGTVKDDGGRTIRLFEYLGSDLGRTK
jgi:hypothetical protein